MSCDFIALANAGVQNLNPYQAGKPIAELQRELGLADIIKLASNENPLGVSPRVQAVCQQQLSSMALYPDSNAYQLKQALASQYNLEPACITLGNGSNNVLDLIAQTFLNSQLSALYSEFAFVVYPLAIQIANAQPIVVPASNWGHDLVAMADAVQENTRLVFLANPNNPTGTYFTHQEIETFLNKVPDNVLVVLDEAYYEYCADVADYPDSLQLQKRYANVIITRTFSKAYALAGLRVGYAISHPDIADVLNRVRAPFNVNSLALAAAEAALDDTAFLSESIAINQQGLQQLQAGLAALEVPYISSVANFISFNVGDAMGCYQYLLEQGVIVRPLAIYQMPEYLRVSVGLEHENTMFLMQLTRWLEKGVT